MVSFSLLFQFTRPRGARPLSGIPQCLQFEVSIHAPAWGATGTGGCSQITDWGFNSRARVGRDALGSVLSALGVVSIHAPAWGATAQNHRLTILVCVSIHAPAWGATWYMMGADGLKEFQFTRPRGARPCDDAEP